ncbi:MAG: hypothetical protein GY803_32135 [Chloroflexi bacterium]|nr:hypothetical protein [Chloroflexota bacterium]
MSQLPPPTSSSSMLQELEFPQLPLRQVLGIPIPDTAINSFRSAILILILLAAFALRLFRLEAQSLWWDEGISLHLATSSLAEIVADRVVNIHPPLYFLGLKVWVALAGTTPFAARYSSALASLLQVTAVYAFSRRWLGRGTAVWLAVGLIAVSPISVIYGQEIRVYALLPLIYLALLTLTGRLTQTNRESSRSLWLGLVVIEAVGLHLHYIVLFLAACISLFALFLFYRRRQWRKLWQWVAAQLAVSLLSLPWFIAILLNRLTVQNRVQTGTFLTEPVSWRFLLSQMWIFHLTGLPGLLASSEVRWLSVWTALGLLGLMALQWRRRRTILSLLGSWLVPLGIALLIWSVRSFSHPRYIVIYAIGLIPLAAYLLASAPRRWLAAGLGLPFVLLSFWGLWAYFFDPNTAKDDMRGVARYLETAAASDDLIIIPDTDWSLPFEYRGEALVVMPGLDGGGEGWEKWGEWTAKRQRVFLVDYPRGTRDWRRVVPFALEKDGSLVGETRFDGLLIREYELTRPLSPPTLQPTAAHFGPLALESAWIEDDVPTNSAVTLALRWHLDQAASARYRIALRLQDVDGWNLAAADGDLLDENGRPPDQWRVGQSATTYHILPIPPGTPPLAYALTASVYAPGPDGARAVDLLDDRGAPQGQQLTLAVVQLAASSGAADNPYRIKVDLPSLPEPLEIVDGLRLLAAMPDRNSLGPGQSLFVQLKWQATAPLPDVRPRLILMQNGNELAAADDAPALGGYPTNHWSAGELVREHRRLVAPPDAVAGPAELALALDGERWALGRIEIAATDKLFEPPTIVYPLDVTFGDVARLIGYDLPRQSFSPGEPIPLTLYWQSLTTGTVVESTGTVVESTGAVVEYIVFAHVLAEDGHLIGQHDAPPRNGRSPTTGWLAGEYVIDPHQMVFRETEYTGQARIEVGLYDPATGARLTTALGDDFFYLPATLEIR